MPYRFHGQRASEEIVLISKQHPFVLFKPFLQTVMILLLPWLAYVFMPFGTLLASILSLSVFIGGLHAFLAWYCWSNSLLLLTNERVVFLWQKSVLNREFSECALTAIQQVSHEIKGLFHTLFGYGSITIYTGGAQVPLRLPNLPDPYDIQQEILQALNQDDFLDESDKPSPIAEIEDDETLQRIATQKPPDPDL